MKDFISLFAAHWPEHLFEQAAMAESQQIVDNRAAILALPTHSSCSGGLPAAA